MMHRLFTLTLLLPAACSLSLPSKYSAQDASSPDNPDYCPEGQIRCGDLCTDLGADPWNCGGCGHACRPDQMCSSGLCACSGFLTDCGGVCVDTGSNPGHCGGCGIACPEGLVCSGGNCMEGCGEGLVDCGGACVDITSSPMNCGGCGIECPGAAGADPACRGSTCALSCWQGRWDLDGLPGCEYECTFTSVIEMCDGADNDCNGEKDEIFSCVRGSGISCIASCGSNGTGVCTETCGIPGGEDCTPPGEICNGLDDDCDMHIDNGFDCIGGLAQSCTTGCGTSGSRTCQTEVCSWGPCCASEETCGNGCDDDCSGVIDDGCGSTPLNDTCASPTEITGTGGRFTGSTAGATDNSGGWCGGTPGGRDVYFSFQISVRSDVFISSFGSRFDTVIYAGSPCGEDNQGCMDDFSGDVHQGFLRIENLAAGRYSIALDGKNGSESGEYVLDVYISPVDDLADKCGRAVRLEGGGESGSTCGFDDDYSGSCSNPIPAGTPERVFFFVVPNSASSINLTFSTCNTTTTYDSLMYIRRICSDSASQVACVDDASCTANPTSSVITTTLTPGIYYLFIDAYGNTSGECGNYLITTY